MLDDFLNEIRRKEESQEEEKQYNFRNVDKAKEIVKDIPEDKLKIISLISMKTSLTSMTLAETCGLTLDEMKKLNELIHLSIDDFIYIKEQQEDVQ